MEHLNKDNRKKEVCRKKLAFLINNNATFNEISEVMNISRPTIYKYIDLYDIPYKNKNSRDNDIKEMFKDIFKEEE